MQPTAYKTLVANTERVCEKIGHVILRNIDSDLVRQMIFDIAKEGYYKSVMEKSKMTLFTGNTNISAVLPTSPLAAVLVAAPVRAIERSARKSV